MKKEEAKLLKELIDSFPPDEETPQTPQPEPSEPKEKVEITKEELNKLFRGLLPEGFDLSKSEPVRSPISGDKVFLRFDGERRWIPDLDTLEKLGWDLGDVKEITDEEIKKLKDGFALLSVKLW